MKIQKADLIELRELHEKGQLSGVFQTSNDDYHAAPGISNSLMGDMDQAAALFKYRLANPEPSTDPMEFGQACHVAVLEPDKFWERYAIAAPELDRRGTKKWEAEELANPGKHLLKAAGPEGGNAVWSMALAAREHTRASLLDGWKELSFFWKDPKTGLLCKCRPDNLTDKGVAVDYKTTISAYPVRKWASIVLQRAYHRQGAFVIRGVAMALEQSGQKVEFPLPENFVLYAQEKEPPYLVKPWNLGPYSQQLGDRECDRILALILACEKSGKWPGYPENVETFEVPEYAFENEGKNE